MGGKHWKQEELSILSKSTELTNRELTNLLPGRTFSSIKCKAYQVIPGLRPHARKSQSIKSRFEKYISPPNINGCWLWTGNIRGEYGRLTIQGKSKKASRISYELHNGPIPEEMCVCHTCDNSICVNPEHLVLGTHQENINDRQEKNRQARGEKIAQAKLTEEQIIQIRQDTRYHRTIAKELNVSKATITHIKSGRNWKHVPLHPL